MQKAHSVRKFFLQHPDSECIPLFLNSFGERDGHGVYQLIEDVISMYSKDQVLPHLCKALESDLGSIKYWNAQIASCFPDKKLINPLKKLLLEKDADIRMAAITALAQINDDVVITILEHFREKEEDQEVLNFFNEVLEDIKN